MYPIVFSPLEEEHVARGARQQDLNEHVADGSGLLQGGVHLQGVDGEAAHAVEAVEGVPDGMLLLPLRLHSCTIHTYLLISSWQNWTPRTELLSLSRGGDHRVMPITYKWA